MFGASQMPAEPSIGLLGRGAAGAQLDEPIDEEAALFERLFGELPEERAHLLEHSVERRLVLALQDRREVGLDRLRVEVGSGAGRERRSGSARGNGEAGDKVAGYALHRSPPHRRTR